MLACPSSMATKILGFRINTTCIHQLSRVDLYYVISNSLCLICLHCVLLPLSSHYCHTVVITY